MPRNFKSWIAAYTEATRHLPSPLRFRTWAAIFTISAALQRRVYVRIYGSKLYPNLYTLLIGEPGVGKSISIKLARKLADDTKLKVAPNRVTNRSFYSVLEASREDKLFNDTLITQSALCAFIPEFGIFVPPGDVNFMYALSDVYDCPDTFNLKTEHAGSNFVENAAFSLIACSTPRILKQVLSEDALELGLGSRLIMIYGEEKISADLFPDYETDEKLEKLLLDDLIAITQISGQYIFSPEAAAFFVDWKKSGMLPVPADPRFRHYNTRRDMHFAKLCVALTASRTDEKIIELQDATDAKELLLEAEVLMPKAVEILGANPLLIQQNQALKLIEAHWTQTKKGLPEHKLRQFLSRDVQPQYIAGLIDLLENGRMAVVAGNSPNRIFLPVGVQ